MANLGDTADDRQLARGLPKGKLGALQLAFEPLSGTLVLACTPTGEVRLPQLFIRRTSDEQYQSVASLLREKVMPEAGPDLMVESWILGGHQLFCVMGEPDLSVAGKAKPVRDRGLATLDLSSGSCSIWDTRFIDSEACLVGRLVGADDGGDTIYAVVGFPAKERIGPVTYYLARLTLSSRQIEKLHLMPDIFF